jgi:hypothetical protein
MASQRGRRLLFATERQSSRLGVLHDADGADATVASRIDRCAT